MRYFLLLHTRILKLTEAKMESDDYIAILDKGVTTSSKSLGPGRRSTGLSTGQWSKAHVQSYDYLASKK